MPINTTLLICQAPPVALPSSWFAHHNWPMISAVERLRLKPCLPVEQNAQSSAQPACVETHSVPLPSSGIYTASTALPVPMSSSHLRVPSSDNSSRITFGACTQAICFSFSRSDTARSLIASKSDSPALYIQRNTCLARKGFSPCSANQAVSCSTSKSRSFCFINGWLARIDVQRREKVGDLHSSRFSRIGTVYRIGINAVGEIGADRALV